MQSDFPQNILKQIISPLQTIYSAEESESLAYLILEQTLNLNRVAVLMNDKIDDSKEKEISSIIDRLLENEPVQHIYGYAYFYDNTYLVNESVLIPRQETEELIQLIIQENPKENLKILDIGTGSGCIACSLALNMNNAKVHAMDVSKAALDVAYKNAKSLNCTISFIETNILKEPIPIPKLDVIVSNPPYITENEKQLMHQNVLAFEPEIALFVSNEDPLIFYNVITQKSKITLNDGGKLYFEINEQFGKEVASLLRDNGFEKVRIIQDLNGKDRFVSGIFTSSYH